MRKIYNELQFGCICYLVLLASPLAAQMPPGGGYTGGGGSTSPTINWNPAFAGTSSAGMIPTFPTGNINTAGWTTSSFIMCYNSGWGWEPECPTCNGEDDDSGNPLQISCRGCNGGGGNGGPGPVRFPSIFRSVKRGVPDNSSSTTNGRSVIDNIRFQYLHWADDFAPGVTGGVNLRRFIRTRHSWRLGSLGPDSFLNVDIKLAFGSNDMIWNPSNIPASELGPSAYLFDPDQLEEIRLFRTSVNKMVAVQRSYVRDLLLYDASMQLVTSTTLPWGGAKYAKLTTLSGAEYLFEIVKANTDASDLVVDGRFTLFKEPRGIAHNITYKSWTPAEISASPTRLWQINQVVDSFSRTMTFSYNASQIGGRWCVSSVAFPDGTQATYNYAGNYLQSVGHADGSTTTISYAGLGTQSWNTNFSRMDIFDPVALPGHRKKTVVMTGGVTTNGTTVVPTGLELIRAMTNGAGEITYFSFLSNGGIHAYEGGGRLKRILSYAYNTSRQGYLLDGWSATTAVDPYTNTETYNVTGTVENEYEENQIDFYRTTAFRDNTGVDTEFKYDAEGRVIYKFYSDSTFESYCYGQNMDVVRYRDREGSVTKSTFDAGGNQLTQQVGLRDNASNSGSTIDPNTGLPVYDRCATNDVQLPEYAQLSWQYDSLGRTTASIDANGNRTDYAYDGTGKLTSITQPPDVTNGTRAQISFTYDNAGRKLTETDPTGNVTQFFYDQVGRPTKVQFSDGSTQETAYGTTGNAIGLPIKKIDRGGVVTEFQYDAAERLVTRINASALKVGNTETPTPSLAMTETWVYLNGTDDPIEHRQAGALRKYVYDYRGRLVKTTQNPRSGKELVASSTYIDNRLFSQQDPYGRKAFYAYDVTDGRMIRSVKGLVPSYNLTTFATVLAVVRNTAPNATYAVQDSVFDSEGHLESQFDARGTETRFEYDSRGRQTNQRQAYATTVEARSETLYDAQGNVTEVRSPRYFESGDTNGYQKAKETWTYTGRNQPKTHTEAVGTPEAATESFTYDLKGRQATHTDFAEKLWATIYDSCCDKSVASKNPLLHGSIRNANSRKQFVHIATVSDVSDHVADMANPINAKTLSESTTRYDGRGRTIATTMWLVPLGAVDPENPPIAGLNGVSANDGLTTQYLYDDNLTDGVGLDSTTGLSFTKMAASGSSSVSLTTAITKLAAAETSGGAGITFSATAPGRASVVINAQDEVSFSISDGAGRTVMSGQLDNYTGTANNLLTWSCQLHDTVTTVAAYGDCLESRSIDALGNVTKSLTDGGGRTIQSIDQLTKVTSFTYDAGGNQLSVRDPNYVGQDVVYDALGRAGLTTDTAGATTNSTYDKAGNRVAAIDGKTQSTTYVFDARGRQKSQQDRNNGTTSFAYLATGQLQSLTDAESQTTSYTYDNAGGKLTEQYPDHTGGTPGQSTYGIVTFTNDAAGRVLRKQDQKGDTCTMNYDLAGRLTSKNYRTLANSPSGTIADTDAFTYDKAGRMLTAVSGRYSNTVTYTFDSAGRKKTEGLTISGQTYTTTTSYNGKGELTGYTYPDGTAVGRSYTARGELYQLTHAGTTIDTRVYDNGGRMTSSTYNNGVSDTRAYNTDNTLVSISFAGASIGNLTYGWDANKNKTSEAIAGTMSNYGFTVPTNGYDSEDRLVGFNRTSGLTQSWNLSLVGDWNSVTTNGTAETRTHGPTHELLTAGGQNVSTDTKGNITLIPAALRPNASSLLSNWDFDNRLNTADVGNNGSIDVTYKFDALGRRVFRDDGTTATVYVQAGQQTIADYTAGTAAASPTYRYVYASYIDEPVLRYKPSASESLYYHRNQQYSVVALTNSSAAIVERYAYSAYGVPTITNASGTVLPVGSVDNRYMYTGREWDSVLAQYHYRARIYDANLGRFASRDPIGFVDLANLYQSLRSSPLSDRDPMGTKSISDESISDQCERLKKGFETNASFLNCKYSITFSCDDGTKKGSPCINKTKGMTTCDPGNKTMTVEVCTNLDHDVAETFRHEFMHVKDQCKCGCEKFLQFTDYILKTPNPGYCFNNLCLEVRAVCEGGLCDGAQDREKCVRERVDYYKKYYKGCKNFDTDVIMNTCYIKQGAQIPDFPLQPTK